MPSRKTRRLLGRSRASSVSAKGTSRRRRQSGGGFFDGIKNGFRRIFTTSEPVAPPSAVPPVAPPPVAPPVPTPPTVPVAPVAPPPTAPMTVNRRQRNIFPPPVNSKIPMIGGSARRTRRRRHRRR